MEHIYLDYGSTAFPKAPGVGQAMADYIDQVGVNIGRGSGVGHQGAALPPVWMEQAGECDFHERRHRVAEHIAQGLSAVW